MLQYIDSYCTSLRLDGETYTAILKPEYAINGERVIKADAKSAYAGKWVTINGARVLIGKNGVVLGGAGGKFNGMNLSDGVRKLHRNREAVVKAKEYKKLKNVADVEYKLSKLDKEINETIYGITMRTKIFGARHFKVTEYKNKLKNLKAERREIVKMQEKAKAKMERIKNKFPDIEKTVENLGNTQKRREANKLRAWAKENGYDPNTNLGTLGNLRHRATEYRRGANGGVWTGDRQDANPVKGKWVTINGAKVLIKGGKFINGPFAGQSVGAGAKYFSASAGNVPEKTRAVLASACSDVDKNGTSSVWMDNYKIDLKKVKDFPKADKVVVTAHNIVQHAGNNKSTITKHPINELGDRLIELHDLVKPKEIVVHSNDR